MTDCEKAVADLEDIFEQPTVKKLIVQEKNLRSSIEEKKKMLKRNASLFDVNTRKSLEVSIKRDERSLLTVEEECKKKIGWYADLSLKRLLTDIVEES